MMIKSATPMQRKILAVSLLFFVIWILFGSVMVPVWGHYSDRSEQIEMLEARAIRYQKIIDQEPFFTERLEQLKSKGASDPLYHGASDADLNALLQRDIRDLFSSADVRIRDMRSLSGMEEDGFNKVSLQMSLRLPMDGFATLLERIMSHQKMIDFENISIKVDQRQDENVPPQLDIDWNIVGFGLFDEGDGDEN